MFLLVERAAQRFRLSGDGSAAWRRAPTLC